MGPGRRYETLGQRQSTITHGSRKHELHLCTGCSCGQASGVGAAHAMGLFHNRGTQALGTQILYNGLQENWSFAPEEDIIFNILNSNSSLCFPV